MIDVSVIVPVYNVERYVTRCLESLRKQDYSNYEVIMVDDGSLDNSSGICKSFLSMSPVFRYYQKINGGLSDARNYGLERARGKYVCFVDADDFVEANYLKGLVETIEKDNSEISVCGFSKETENGKLLDTFSPTETLSSGLALIDRALSADDGWHYIVVWNKLFRKEILGKAPFQNNRLFEDEFSLTDLYVEPRRIAYCSQSLYHYLERSNSIVNSPYSHKKFIDTLDYNLIRIDSLKNVANIETLRNAQYIFCTDLCTVMQIYPEISLSELSKVRINLRRNILAASKSNRCSFWDRAKFFSMMVSPRITVSMIQTIKRITGRRPLSNR